MTDSITQSAPASASRRWIPFVGIGLLLMLIAWATWSVQRWFDQRTAKPAVADPVTQDVVIPSDADPRKASGDVPDSQWSAQLADIRRVNSVLREQVLALTDRVRVLQDQVQASQSGGTPQQLPLALAEQWLELAQARLDLFADAGGAARALMFADQALMRSQDPSAASLRQTLMIESAALQSSALADPVRAASTLAAYAEASRQWPKRASETNAQEAGFFSRYFSIRTRSSSEPLSTPDQAALRAELLWARVLVARGDWRLLIESLDRCRQDIEQLFDASSPPVREALDALAALAAEADRTRGVQLGSTLRELRALTGAGAPMPVSPSASLDAKRDAEVHSEPASGDATMPGAELPESSGPSDATTTPTTTPAVEPDQRSPGAGLRP